MNARPKLLTLDCELKLAATPQKEGEPNYHFSAVVKKATFNSVTYEIQNSKDMAETLAKKIAYKAGIGDNNFLNAVEFAQALPGALPSNIAVCYFGKFRDKNNPNKNDAEKIERARKLEGTSLTLTLDPANWKILLPHGTKETPTDEITKLKEDLSKVLNSSDTSKIAMVPLTNFNTNSNILSLQISDKAHNQLLNLAAEVTGDEKTAVPTNSEGNPVPFSFSIAKLPNLLPVCENILASRNTTVLKCGS